jgi:molybdopterin synthase sulfur carrier subunit
MEITVIAFGQLAELTGKSNWMMSDIHDTEQLKQEIELSYPSIKNIHYLVAINKKIAKEKTEISANATVALLPPFSGG